MTTTPNLTPEQAQAMPEADYVDALRANGWNPLTPCPQHRAFEVWNCQACGTAARIAGSY